MAITGCLKLRHRQFISSQVSPSSCISNDQASKARPTAPASQPNPAPSSPAATTPPVTASPTSPALQVPRHHRRSQLLSPFYLQPDHPLPSGALLSLLITAPLNVSTVPAGDVTISTIVSNFNLVDKIGQASVSGEGHIIYYMDVTPPTIQNQTATTATGTYVESTATSYTWHNVQAGIHYFSVQLVNNDSTPLIPPITVTVYVTVQGTTQPNPSPS